jgi:hypothetical protein
MLSRLGFQYAIVILIIGQFLLISCNPHQEKIVEIRGVYGNPKPFWDKGIELKQLGVNAIFVHSGAINQMMVDRAQSEGLKIYAEFAT